MADMQVTSRRDMREAVGYLTDLMDQAPDSIDAHSLDWVVKFIIAHTARINVQRSSDMLVLYFDLDEEEAPTVAESNVVPIVAESTDTA